MRLIFVILLLTGCGASAPPKPDSPELVELKNRLTGSGFAVASPTEKFEDNSEALEKLKKLSPAEFEEIERGPWQIEVDECEKDEPETQADADTYPHPEEPDPNPFADWYVVEFGARWCGPCKQWQNEEMPKLIAAGIQVRTIDCDEQKDEAKRHKIKKYPTIMLCQRSTGKVHTRWTGYVPSGRIMGAILPQRKAAQPADTSLITWIRENYKPGQWLEYDVQPRSAVWDHLVEHGFSRSEISGLPFWEALCLHDARHRGLK